MKTLAMLLFLASFIAACNSNKTLPNKEDNTQQSIDKATIMKNIDGKVNTIKAIAETELKEIVHQLMGGGRTFYVNKEGKLVKIVAGMLGAAMTLETVFYVVDNSLIYLDQTMTDYKRRDAENAENPYKEYSSAYFDKESMIEYKAAANSSLKEDEIKQKGQQFISDYKAFMEEYKSVK